MEDDFAPANLEKFLRKALDIQLSDAKNDLSQGDLKAIALRAGLTETDWNRICAELDDHLNRGRNFLKFGNSRDAIQELDQAVVLSPYRVDVLADCAEAYQLNWKETGDPKSQMQADDLYKRCLQIDASNERAARGITELRQSQRNEKHGGRKRKRVWKVAALAGIVFIVAGISYISGGVAWQLQGHDPTGLETGAPKFLEQEVRSYGGHRYLLIKIPLSQTEASDYCQRLGGRLVTVDGSSENRWLYEAFGTHMAFAKMNVWLGASDAEEEGIWKWGNGKQMDFQKWADGGPNNRGDEDGALMLANSDSWNDASVTINRWFFCEWDNWPPQLADDVDLEFLRKSF